MQYTKDLVQEKDKAEYGFVAREKATERIGLPEVQSYRLAKMQQEQAQWQIDFTERQKIKPELNALLVLRVKPRSADT